jgi:DNA-binding response OmpR family regulator/ribosomal protein S8
MELLRKKKDDPNTINTPVIIMAQKIEQKQLLELVPYNVKKVFSKPIKIDALYASLSDLLGVPFSIDDTPGIVEVHVNDSIIFIEIAQGLNQDKIDLLRFKIAELIELYEIRVPKVIIMLSDIKLNFADAPKIQSLFQTVIQSSKAKQRFIRVLTKDNFVRQFVNGQKDYSEIAVVTNLRYAMDDLLANIGREEHEEKKAELISDRVLRAKTREGEEAMALKFDAETKNISLELMKDSVKNIKIAVVDDDIATQELIKNTFKSASVSVFPGGKEFIACLDTMDFNLAFLDLKIPGADGFEVLKVMQTRDIRYPVIVLSSIAQRETMIRAIQMGVKSYLIKPLKPDDIYRKSMEILKANF